MLWRVWCFAAGLPLGALSLLAVQPSPSRFALELAAGAGGLVLLVIASLLARARDDDPERGRHLAASASVALAALPGLGAALLDVGPSPPWFASVVGIALAVALARGAWHRGPAGGVLRAGIGVLAALAGGVALVIAWSVIGGAFETPAPPPNPQQARAVYDLDARVVTRALPRCSAQPARIETLLDRGAHPRIAADGVFLWFDARADDGHRQVYRMDLASREMRCWTCGEDGENQRPSPNEDSTGVVFETDRWATAQGPTNSEIQIIAGKGADPGLGSRRLTVAPGRDSHPIFGPGAGLLTWSRSAEGRSDVVSAPLRSGHGGLMLGAARTLFAGGAAWAAPLAWSPDARSLVVVHGNPLRPLAALSIDLATGAARSVGPDVPGSASASFSADGGWLAVPTTTRGRVPGLLPARLGFLVAPFDALIVGDGRRFQDSGVRAGEPWGEGAALALGDVETWGEPTGVALEPDGQVFLLGQRRRTAQGMEERIVRVVLDCASPGGV